MYRTKGSGNIKVLEECLSRSPRLYKERWGHSGATNLKEESKEREQAHEHQGSNIRVTAS